MNLTQHMQPDAIYWTYYGTGHSLGVAYEIVQLRRGVAKRHRVYE